MNVNDQINGWVTVLNQATDALTKIGESIGKTYEETVTLADRREREFYEANDRRIAELRAKREERQ